MPASWQADTARLADAGVPAEVGFATKPELAWKMIERAADDPLLVFRWVTGDEAYGDNTILRGRCQSRGLNYVFAVSCDHPLQLGGDRTRADRAFAALEETRPDPVPCAGTPAGSPCVACRPLLVGPKTHESSKATPQKAGRIRASNQTGGGSNTAGSPGRHYAAANAAAAGGPPARTDSCSIPRRSAPRATATGAQPSRPPGRPQDEETNRINGTWGAPGSLKGARRVREAVRGKRSGRQDRHRAPG